MSNAEIGEEHMCELQQNTEAATGKNPNSNEQNESTASVWCTEGCIRELKLKGGEVTLKIEPTEAFAFGVDDTKKILFVIGEKPNWEGTNPVDAKLVEVETEFVVDKEILVEGEKAGILTGLLYALKKDHARIRMAVDDIRTSKPHIQSIEFI